MRNNAPLGWAALALSLVLLGSTHSAHAQSGGDGGGWLGILSQSLTPELRNGIGYNGAGVLVNQVVENSPADRAGIEKGDVIVSVDQRPVESPEALVRMIRSQSAEKQLAIRIVRDGKGRTLQARLSARPGSSDDNAEDNDGEGDDLGHLHDIPELSGILDLEELRHMVRNGRAKAFHMRGMPGRARLGVQIEDAPDTSGRGGAQVVEVMEDTPAERAGIKVGDVITQVEGESIGDATDLIQALRGKSGRVEIKLRRRGSPRTVAADLEAIPPRAMRMKLSHPHAYEWREDSGDHSHLHMLDDGKSSDELQHELSDLRRELAELRKELVEMKRER